MIPKRFKQRYKIIFEREDIRVVEKLDVSSKASDRYILHIGMHTEFHSEDSLDYALSRWLQWHLDRSVTIERKMLDGSVRHTTQNAGGTIPKHHPRGRRSA